MEDLKYEEQLNAFFKQFEIPELQDIHLLPKQATWQILASPTDTKVAKSSSLFFYDSRIDFKDYIIVLTASQGIDRFDISSNTIEHLTDFPDDFKCKGAEIALNTNNGNIYMMGGMSKCFGIYSIETNKWDIKCSSNSIGSHDKYALSSVDNQPKVIDDILYINGWDANKYYDVEQDEFIEISLENTSLSTSKPSSNKETIMIYHEKLNKYMHFGSDSSYLFSKELCNEVWLFGQMADDDRCLWHMSEIGLPPIYKTMSLKYALSCENIIILIYFSKQDSVNSDILQNEIYCMDLSEGKWYKCKAYLDDVDDVAYDEYYMFITNDAKIHMLYFDENDSKHLTVDMKDILNDELYKKHNTKCTDIINGFMKSIPMENDQNDQNDTDLSIHSTILQYYTSLI